METTYNIKVTSRTNAILVVFLCLGIFISGIFMFAPHGIQNTGLAILIVATYAVITFFIWQKLVTGKTKWTIDENGVYMSWVKHFAFNSNEDLAIQWNEIESIRRGFDPNYYNLKIKLTSGKTVNFYHDLLTTRDNFKEFLVALNQKHK